MSAWTQKQVDAHNARIGAKLPAHRQPDHRSLRMEQLQEPPKRSKYRNVRTNIGGEVFDSKREADYWLVLKAREGLHEISDLKRQVKFPLYTPQFMGGHGQYAEDSIYIADYTYTDAAGALHVVDAKGHRTREYRSKAKRLFLQQEITVEEV